MAVSLGVNVTVNVLVGLFVVVGEGVFVRVGVGVEVLVGERVTVGDAVAVYVDVGLAVLVAVSVVVWAAHPPAVLALAIAEPRIPPGFPLIVWYHSTFML